MGLTVSQIQIQYSEELSLRLVAGRNGIGREVKKMAVMETRDFVYGADPDGMFVITTLSFVDKESRGIDEVIKLLSAQPSAMAVKINRYVKSIPLEIQDAAEKENVPLFEMDSDVQFSYFISVLSEALVLNSGLKVETGNCLLDDVLFQDTKDGVLIRNRLSYGGFELSDLYVFILVSVEKGKAESSDSSVMECCRKQILDCFPECLIKVDSHMLKCLVTFSKKDFFSKNGRLYDRMIAFRNSIFSKNGGIFDIGISLIQDNPADLTQSYLQAHAAVNMGKIYRPDKHVYDYRSFLVQGMLASSRGTQEYQWILENIVEPVSKRDQLYESGLWESLDVLFKVRSLKTASDELHIHISTLRYRLQKIKEITGFDYLSAYGNYVLHTAYLIWMDGKNLDRKTTDHIFFYVYVFMEEVRWKKERSII